MLTARQTDHGLQVLGLDDFRTALQSVREAISSSLNRLAEERNPSAAVWQDVEQTFAQGGESLGLAIRDLASIRDLHGQAKAFGLTIKYSDRLDFEGDLLPSAKGLIIRIPSWQPLTRARATFAHELGHTFFWIERRGHLQRLLNYLGSEFSAAQEERVCWRFARSYLMPKTLLRGWVALSPSPSAKAIRALAESNAISLDMLMIRFEDERLLSEAALSSVRQLDPDEYECAFYVGEEASRRFREKGIQQPNAYLSKLFRESHGVEAARRFLTRNYFSVSVSTSTDSSQRSKHSLLAAYALPNKGEESNEF